jgi:hypothetical protein
MTGYLMSFPESHASLNFATAVVSRRGRIRLFLDCDLLPNFGLHPVLLTRS